MEGRIQKLLSRFYASSHNRNDKRYVDCFRNCAQNQNLPLQDLLENRKYTFSRLPDGSMCIEQNDISLYIKVSLDCSSGVVNLAIDQFDPVDIEENKREIQEELILRGLDVFAKILTCVDLYGCYIFFFRPKFLFYNAVWRSLGLHIDPAGISRGNVAIPGEEAIKERIGTLKSLF